MIISPEDAKLIRQKKNAAERKKMILAAAVMAVMMAAVLLLIPNEEGALKVLRSVMAAALSCGMVYCGVKISRIKQKH